MIFKSRNLVNFILNFFKLCCCYRLTVSAYIVRVQSEIACITAFSHILLPPLHDYNVKLLNFTFFAVCKQKTTTFFFSS